jgi:hypothetical protein
MEKLLNESVLFEKIQVKESDFPLSRGFSITNSEDKLYVFGGIQQNDYSNDQVKIKIEDFEKNYEYKNEVYEYNQCKIKTKTRQK